MAKHKCPCRCTTGSAALRTPTTFERHHACVPLFLFFFVNAPTSSRSPVPVSNSPSTSGLWPLFTADACGVGCCASTATSADAFDAASFRFFFMFAFGGCSSSAPAADATCSAACFLLFWRGTPPACMPSPALPGSAPAAPMRPASAAWSGSSPSSSAYSLYSAAALCARVRQALLLCLKSSTAHLTSAHAC